MATRILLTAVGLAILLTACGIDIKPSTHTPVGELPKRPGLFSDDDGEFVIFRR